MAVALEAVDAYSAVQRPEMVGEPSLWAVDAAERLAAAVVDQHETVVVVEQLAAVANDSFDVGCPPFGVRA